MNMNVTKIDNGEVLINLNNYCGTLRVKNTGLKANDDINDDENMSIDTNNNLGAPKVTDTPSPPMKSCEGNEEELAADGETKDQKGQQKLNFFGKPGKKVNSKKSEVCTMICHFFFWCTMICLLSLLIAALYFFFIIHIILLFFFNIHILPGS